jgi:hypothetical protein
VKIPARESPCREFLVFWNLLALRLGSGYVIRWEPSLIFEVWDELSRASWRNETVSERWHPLIFVARGIHGSLTVVCCLEGLFPVPCSE